MSVSVLVPYRSDGGDRDRAWAYVRRWWATQHPDWQVVEGECPDGGPWVKAVAVADALRRADGQVLVVADADVICDGVAAAVQAVAGGQGWAVPHLTVCRLNAQATGRVYGGAHPRHTTAADLARPAYRGVAGGGITVLTRDLYERAPLDPRFLGWGQEDQAAAAAWSALAGPCWRGEATLWHLWHEPQPRLNAHVGSPAGLALLVRYQYAQRDLDAMRQLVTEAKEALWPAPGM